jgi:hypothetical protein
LHSELPFMSPFAIRWSRSVAGGCPRSQGPSPLELERVAKMMMMIMIIFYAL